MPSPEFLKIGWFYEYGQPLRLRTDNGLQFRTEFDKWCESMGIVHEKSSPEHHESNGHVESAIKELTIMDLSLHKLFI